MANDCFEGDQRAASAATAALDGAKPPKKRYFKKDLAGSQVTPNQGSKLPKVNEAPLSRHAAEPQACFFSK
jgi:hypothetical protein